MPTPRLHRGLVALSASAVAAVYMAGYMRTQSADASIGAAADSAASAPSVTVVATQAPGRAAPRGEPTPASVAARSSLPPLPPTPVPQVRAAPTAQVAPAAPAAAAPAQGAF